MKERKLDKLSVGKERSETVKKNCPPEKFILGHLLVGQKLL